MKFDGNRIFSFMLAAAFALTLAGCGGGGGTAQMPDTMPDPQMECEGAGGRWADMTCTSAEELTMERQAAQRTAISTAISAASEAVAVVNDDSTDANVMAADAAIEAANAAIADAADVPEAEKAAHSGRVSQIEGRLSAALESRTAAMDAAADAAQMALNAMAMKLYAGLNPFVLAANRPSVGTLSLTGSSLTGTFDTDGFGGTEAAQAAVTLPASGAATPSAGGWAGTDYVLTAGGVTNHAVVYRNQGPPTVEAFEVTHAGIIADGAIPSTATGFDTFNIMGAEFASGAGSKTHAVPDNAVYVSVRGTFDGAPGEFRCTADCVSSVDSDTGVSLAGTWSFRADTGAMTSRPDADYNVFGWWARDDGTSVRVAPFVFQVGTETDITTSLGPLQGEATYVGGAAGKVAVFNPLSDVNNAAGAFTADATLTAKFGDASVLGTVSGTIDNFSVEGEAKDWSVALKDATIGSGAQYSSGDNATTWTIGGTAAADSGWWAGSLYDLDDGGVPQSTIGTISAEYGNIGAMVGTFGADKQ